MTILHPVVKVDLAVGGGIVVIFASGKRLLYSEELLKAQKEN